MKTLSLLLVISMGGLTLSWSAFTGTARGHAPEQHGFRITHFDPPAAAPAFTVAASAGGRTSLADYRGKVVLLNFWATWCPPCVKEMPSMERLYQAYKGGGLVVLAISLDQEGAARVAPFVKRLGLTFPIGLDQSSRVAGLYGAGALPSSFLIDRQGRVIAGAKGERDWFSDEAISYFDELLPGLMAATGPQTP